MHVRPAYTHAEALTTTRLAASKRAQGVIFAATVAGTVIIVLESGAQMEIPVPAGTSKIDDLAVVAIAAGGTATATAYAMFVGA